MGNGQDTFLWLDNWLQGGSLLSQGFYNPIVTKHWYVSDIVEGNVWVRRDAEIAQVWNIITEITS